MRYDVYYWDVDAQKDIEKDFKKSVEELLDKGYVSSIIDYGTKIGNYNSEYEANEAASAHIDSYDHRNDIVSIYDNEKKIWFN